MFGVWVSCVYMLGGGVKKFDNGVVGDNANFKKRFSGCQMPLEVKLAPLSSQ